MADAATEVDKMAALATAANEARGLAMDSIAAAHSGHMGLPLGCAEIGATLYGSQVSVPIHSLNHPLLRTTADLLYNNIVTLDAIQSQGYHMDQP